MGLADHCEYAGPEYDSPEECEVNVSDDDEEPVITVGDVLLSKMRAEVTWARGAAGLKRCPLCPFRKCNRAARLLHHINICHTEQRQYLCSGTKQLKVGCALFDSDQIALQKGSRYMSRSAEILRATVSPPLASDSNGIDRHIRLVFAGAGPQFWNKAVVDESDNLRRVRNVYYTVEFADVVYRELLLCNAKCKAAIPRILQSIVSAGSHLASLMPRHVKD